MALPPRDDKGRFQKPNEGLKGLLDGQRTVDEKNTDRLVKAIEGGGGDISGKEAQQEQASQRKQMFAGLSSSILGGLGKLGDKFDKGFNMRELTVFDTLKLPLLLAGAVVYQYSAVLTGAIITIKGILKGLPTLFTVGKNIVKGIGGLFARIKSGKIVGSIIRSFKSVFGALGKSMGKSKLFGFFGKVFNKIKPVFTFLGKIFGRFKPVMGIFSKIFGVVGTVGKTAGGVFATIGKVFKTIFGFVKPVVGFVGKLGGVLGKVFKAVPILGQIITIIEGVVGFFRGFFGTEGSFFEKLIGGIKGIFAQIIEGLSFGFISFDSVMEFFDNLTIKMGDFFYGAFVFFTETIPEIFMSAVNGVKDFFIMVFDFYTVTVPNLFMSGINAIGNFFTVTIPNAFNSVLGFITSGFGVLSAFVQGPIDSIKRFFVELMFSFAMLKAKMDYGIAYAINKASLGVFGSEGLADAEADEKKIMRNYARFQQMNESADAARLQAQQGSAAGGTVNQVNTTAMNTQSFETSEEPATDVAAVRYVGA